MRNKIIVIIIIISFVTGVAQLIINNTQKSDALAGATQGGITSNTDGQTGPSINGSGESLFIDGLTGASTSTEQSGLDGLSGASTQYDEDDEYEHEDDEHEHEDEFEWEFDD